MPVSFRRPALLVAATIAAVALTPVASFAGSYVHFDPTADMVTFDQAGENQTPAPEHTNADITRLGVTVGQTYLKTRLTFKAMRIGDNDGVNPVWRINTNEGKHFILSGYFGGANRKGDWQLMKESGPGVRCTLTHTIDYTAHTVLVGVPVGCLSTPSYVRVGARADNLHFVADDTQESGFRVEDYADDAQSNTLGAAPLMSPRIKRN